MSSDYEDESCVQIIANSNEIEIICDQDEVIVNSCDSIIDVLTLGIQGSAGPAGSSSNPLFTAMGSGTITAGQVIVINDSGEAVIADPTNADQAEWTCGMAMSSGTDEDIDVMLFGLVTGLGSLNPGPAYFLGLNGSLNTVSGFNNSDNPYPTGAAWFIYLGNALSNSSFIFNPGKPVLL
jgi:hypothetical protein